MVGEYGLPGLENTRGWWVLKDMIGSSFYPETNGKVWKYQQTFKNEINQVPKDIPSGSPLSSTTKTDVTYGDVYFGIRMKSWLVSCLKNKLNKFHLVWQTNYLKSLIIFPRTY